MIKIEKDCFEISTVKMRIITYKINILNNFIILNIVVNKCLNSQDGQGKPVKNMFNI